jgi:hypothetical protein
VGRSREVDGADGDGAERRRCPRGSVAVERPATADTATWRRRGSSPGVRCCDHDAVRRGRGVCRSGHSPRPRRNPRVRGPARARGKRRGHVNAGVLAKGRRRFAVARSYVTPRSAEVGRHACVHPRADQRERASGAGALARHVAFKARAVSGRRRSGRGERWRVQGWWAL